jgi:hypothetical protein
LVQNTRFGWKKIIPHWKIDLMCNRFSEHDLGIKCLWWSWHRHRKAGFIFRAATIEFVRFPCSHASPQEIKDFAGTRTIFGSLSKFSLTILNAVVHSTKNDALFKTYLLILLFAELVSNLSFWTRLTIWPLPRNSPYVEVVQKTLSHINSLYLWNWPNSETRAGQS